MAQEHGCICDVCAERGRECRRVAPDGRDVCEACESGQHRGNVSCRRSGSGRCDTHGRAIWPELSVHCNAWQEGAEQQIASMQAALERVKTDLVTGGQLRAETLLGVQAALDQGDG
jgi:hypothetical protein